MLSKYVVLSTEGIMRLFREHIQQYDKPASLPEDILQEIMKCIEVQHKASNTLDEMLNQMFDKMFEYDYDRATSYDINQYVDAAVVGFATGLAVTILQQLERIGAYSPMGLLLYEYHPTKDEKLTTIILRLKDGQSTEKGIQRVLPLQSAGYLELAPSSY